MLERPDRLVAQRNTAIQFGIVCVGYLLLWFISRLHDRGAAANIALHPTAAV